MSDLSAQKVVIATNNAHKLEEICRILAPTGWDFVSLSECGDFPEPVEDADSFEGNARIKAQAAHVNTGLAALADDSGLQVLALEGAPGVYSSRFAGEDASDADNNALLLEKLAEVPGEERTARFVCSLVFIDAEGNEQTAFGTCDGRIGYEPKGTNGFGYDPLFISDDCGGRTTAQVPADEKNRISHRGRALQALVQKLV